MISRDKRVIVFTEDLLYGLFASEDGDNYMFDYGTEKDEGLGVVTNQRTMEMFTIINEEHNNLTGNIISVTVQV